ncbi:MAG: hypothetical protein R2911_43180 [Caldilineaceae bacterium]
MAVASKVVNTARSTSGTELLMALAGEFNNFSHAAQARPEFAAHNIESIKAEALADINAAAELLQQKATAAESAEIRHWHIAWRWRRLKRPKRAAFSASAAHA